MPNTAIKVSHLTKVYKLYDKPIDRLKESLHPLKKKYHKDFYALNDVSFEIKKGETVGIIGKNGAGKSTLLKIITGVLTPSNGHVHTNGRISSLLELGAGFNPEYTGVENIYLQGILMGYSHSEMEAKVDEILSFADIGDFIYQPVKMYSSGMFARLAFAVAINVDPDILIVDEVLSVGDARFQNKCIKKMEIIRSNGTTILFVSHAIEQVKRFCQKSLWIDNGKLRQFGEQNIVADLYIDSLHLESMHNNSEQKSLANISMNSSSQAKILSLTIEKNILQVFDSLVVNIEYEIFDDFIEDLLIGVAIFDAERNYIFGPNTYLDKYELVSTKGIHTIKYEVPRIPLTAGTYFLDTGLFTEKGIVSLDYHFNINKFNIYSDYFTEGKVYLEHNWKH